jgi:nucleoid-associated protein YgaU
VDRKKKIALAALILGVGVGVALQFRKIESGLSHSDSSAQSAVATDGQSMTAAPAVGVFPKPSSAFEGRIEPPPSDSAVSNAQREKASLGGLQSVANGDENEHPLADLNEPDKIHKIIDGDTLAKLAQRYWGRADRYVDLYSYNRDVLSDPDVLPIGAELRIPAHLVISTDPDQAATAPVLPLAPLPKLATSGAPAVPAAAAQQPSQRTYKVQPGDNLVDIARKLYGDGRRHTDLFEANRRVMRTPTDLKPGMLLVVP